MDGLKFNNYIYIYIMKIQSPPLGGGSAYTNAKKRDKERINE